MAFELQALPFTEAIAALDRRGQNQKTQFSHLDDFQADHATMFTVAKSTGFDIVGDIADGFGEIFAQGRTSRDFVKQLTPILQAKGWWGRQRVTDPLTGEEVIAQLGSVRRLQLIFDTNMRVSYAAGHWASFERNKATRPFLRYVHLEGQENPRLQHQAWHNTVLPVDHPWWNTHACPNGFGCKCTLQSLSQRDVDRLLSRGVPLRFEAPAITMRDWLNKRTGEITKVPDGIDPGWAYNPGKAGHQAAIAGADKLVDAPPALAAAAAADLDWIARPLERELTDWLAEIRDGDPPGGRSRVTLGAMGPGVLDALLKPGPGRAPVALESAAITLDADVARQLVAAGHEVARLPQLLARPQAVLRDGATGDLVAVVADPAAPDMPMAIRLAPAIAPAITPTGETQPGEEPRPKKTNRLLAIILGLAELALFELLAGTW